MATIDKRERILASFKVLLEGLKSPSLAATVERNWPDSLPVGKLPALLMFDGEQSAGREQTLTDTYRLEVDLELIAGGPSNEAAAGVLNDLWARVVEATFADRTLGGLADNVAHNELTDIQFMGSDKARRIASGVALFVIDYETPEGNLYA